MSNFKSLLDANEHYQKTFGRGWRPGYIESQRPHTAVLACSDSRVPVEKIFDLYEGELFVVREAGHVPSFNSIASLEFAILSLGIQRLLVLGHTECGAVNGALSFNDLGTTSLNLLAGEIRKNISVNDTLDKAIENNARETLKNLIQNSKTISNAYNTGIIKFAYGIFNIQNGGVDIFEL